MGLPGRGIPDVPDAGVWGQLLMSIGSPVNNGNLALALLFHNDTLRGYFGAAYLSSLGDGRPTNFVGQFHCE